MTRGRLNWPFALVVLLTLAALALRVRQYDLSLLGDELSTLSIVRDSGLRGVIDQVSSDAEITPPLYFTLAWLATKLGSAPELVRLPALVAGVASVPMLYLLGLRTVGRTPGLIGAFLMAVAPSMIYYSGSGRAYSLMLFLAIASTLAMLAAIRTGRTRWWVAYAAASVLAVYSHYTVVLVLAAQFLWLLWAHPEHRRPAFLANLAAGVAFLPWIPGLLSDFDSPTRTLLEGLQGQGVQAKRFALEQWVIGHPLVDLARLPGLADRLIVWAGIALATVVFFAQRIGTVSSLRQWARDHRPAVLVLALALVAPVVEGILALLGSDIFGARNLAPSWPGMALAVGALLTAIGPVWGGICGVAVLGGFLFAGGKSTDPGLVPTDYRAAAERIETEAGPGDLAVDLVSTPYISPVPLTPLQLYIGDRTSRIALDHPVGPPPFLPGDPPVPEPGERLRSALTTASGGDLFIVAPEAEVTVGGVDRPEVSGNVVALPDGWQVVSRSSYPGMDRLNLIRVRPPGE